MMVSMLRRILPQSVKGRLTAMLMVAMTCLMCAFAALSYYLTQQWFEQQKNAAKASVSQQLAGPASKALWNFDAEALNALLDAALRGSVTELVVYTDTGKEFARRSVLAANNAKPLPQSQQTFDIDLPPVNGRAMGRIRVSWSDASLKDALHATLRRSIVEIIVVNAVLLGLFWFSMDRLVFRRVAELQNALDQAISRQGARRHCGDAGAAERRVWRTHAKHQCHHQAPGR